MIRLALQTQKSGKRSLRSPLYQIEYGHGRLKLRLADLAGICYKEGYLKATALQKMENAPRDRTSRISTLEYVSTSGWSQSGGTVFWLKTPACQGNLDELCTDALIWELMLQAGSVG
jgi:hypothetical protein